MTMTQPTTIAFEALSSKEQFRLNQMKSAARVKQLKDQLQSVHADYQVVRTELFALLSKKASERCKTLDAGNLEWRRMTRVGQRSDAIKLVCANTGLTTEDSTLYLDILTA
jgi:hypothetical protein